MRSIELTEETIEAAQQIINIPLSYKKLMLHLGQNILAGKSKVCQIEDLRRYQSQKDISIRYRWQFNTYI